MKKLFMISMVLILLISPIFATTNQELPEDGNIGDLKLEDGAVLWTEMSEEERADYERKQAELNILSQDPKYLEALRKSKELENNIDSLLRILNILSKRYKINEICFIF